MLLSFLKDTNVFVLECDLRAVQCITIRCRLRHVLRGNIDMLGVHIHPVLLNVNYHFIGFNIPVIKFGNKRDNELRSVPSWQTN